jgi:hypothetical protein
MGSRYLKEFECPFGSNCVWWITYILPWLIQTIGFWCHAKCVKWAHGFNWTIDGIVFILGFGRSAYNMPPGCKKSKPLIRFSKFVQLLDFSRLRNNEEFTSFLQVVCLLCDTEQPVWLLNGHIFYPLFMPYEGVVMLQWNLIMLLRCHKCV